MKHSRKPCLLLAMCFLTGLMWANYSLLNLNLPGVYAGPTQFADYDSDGDLDFILTGSTLESGYGIARLYTNNGNGQFTLNPQPFTGVFRGSVDWGDYNNDSYPDLVISGWATGGVNVTKLYRNLGNGNFELINAGFIGVNYSSVEWADYNLDGWLDLLVAGANDAGIFSKIYRNNQNGTFTDINANLRPISYGTASWGDFDNDGDPDIVFLGSNHTEVYENLGDDVFVDIEAGLLPLYYGAAAWGDYDNDGYLDLVCQGMNEDGYFTKLYRNNRAGGFEDVPHRMQSVFGGSVAWGDYNSDGKPDILLTGYFNGNRITKIYRNDNWGIFVDTGDVFPALSSSWGSWADYDNDGKLDILLTGFDGSDGVGYHSKLYKNNYSFVNTNPGPPVLVYDQASASFQFSGASDLSTPYAGLTYDLRIGTSPGACDISSPLAHPDGRRKTESRGRKAIAFDPQPGVLYYAAAQTVDQGFARSVFSPEISFGTGGTPLISVIGSMDFGSVYLEHHTHQDLILANPGTGTLSIESVALSSGLSFQIEAQTYPQHLNGGATWSLRVTFSPLANGLVADTLVIQSNAQNSPVLRVPVGGRGVSAPPSQVQNLNVLHQGNDALLSWDPVTTTTAGDPITPSLYLVLINEIPNDLEHFWFLAATPNTSHLHPSVFQFSPNMFYQVRAVVLYDDEQQSMLKNLEQSGVRLDWASLKEMME
ncbi:MAG TPA: VCBS repeat-containing protein [Candidatus Cloacimonadota bacterium]|nr:VCBS repeat-containing protein [Candidatus Cloacimonadota bacterium]